PISVQAVGRDSIVRGTFDVAFVTLRYASGIIANVELSWLSPSKLRRTVVVGSGKMVVYEDGAPEPIRLFDHGVVYEAPETFRQSPFPYRAGAIVSRRLESYEPLSAELGAFATAARNGARLPYYSRLACDVVRITEAADQSLLLGGAEIAISEARTGQLVAA